MGAQRVPVAVFVSGGGTNLQALIDAQTRGALTPAEIVLVVSDRADAYALARAQKAGIPTLTATSQDARGDAWDTRVLDALRDAQVELIVLAGFLRVLSHRFVDAYPSRILNIHPALLPAFGGRGYYGLHVHEAVLAHGVQVTGATVHIVNEEPDGGPIVAQKGVRVLPDDTPEVLQRRVMEEAEWVLLPLVTATMARRIADGVTGEALQKPLDPACRVLSLDLPEAMDEALSTLPVQDITPAQSGTQVGDAVPLWNLVTGNPYPGRGIALAHGPHGETLVAYFIMGRSANSRNRVFRLAGDDLYTEAHDPALVEDPSLIIYRALSHPTVDGMRVTVVTNGDQTDTILDGLSQGLSFDDALKTRRFEPDGPHFTPRISGLLQKDALKLSIWKALDGAGEKAGYFSFGYEAQPGIGYFISTYQTDDAVLPTFSGEPLRFAFDGDAHAFTEHLWDALDAENRIALYVESTGPQGEIRESRSRFADGAVL